jgi:hypothetical protein
VHAVGALQLHGLEPELRKLENAADPALLGAARSASQRLAGESDPEQQVPIPADMGLNVGAG